MELDTFLAPYPEEQHSTWRHLTSLVATSHDVVLYLVSSFRILKLESIVYLCLSKVSKEVLNECGMPLETKILPGDDMSDRRDMVEQQDEVKDSHNTIHVSFPSPGNIASSTPGLAQAPRFIPLGNAFGRAEEVKGLTPEERTRYSMDRSRQLQSLVLERFFGDWKKVLGEIQVPLSNVFIRLLGNIFYVPIFTLCFTLLQTAFISFLILSSPMGLRHWQVHTMCSFNEINHLSTFPVCLVVFDPPKRVNHSI